ncbi:MAG: hypothetical protein FJ292_04550 [Planctomycetes bacterium]|nr:hypothetical protein [Planctomycetota bacterium]
MLDLLQRARGAPGGDPGLQRGAQRSKQGFGLCACSSGATRGFGSQRDGALIAADRKHGTCGVEREGANGSHAGPQLAELAA